MCQLHDGNLKAAAYIVGLPHEALLLQQQEGVDNVIDEQEVSGYREHSLDGAEAHQEDKGEVHLRPLLDGHSFLSPRSDALTIFGFSATTRGILEWPEKCNV